MQPQRSTWGLPAGRARAAASGARRPWHKLFPSHDGLTVRMPGPATADQPGLRAKRRRALPVCLALLCALGLGLAYLFGTAKPQPSIPLGASAVVPGGMASISEIVPLESDGWQPGDGGAALAGSPAEGSHRVRLVVHLTALERDGVQLAASDFSVTGLGALRAQPLWSSAPELSLPQGQSTGATLVFEIPDKAVALVLEGPGNARLSMGQAHHSG